MPKDTATVTPTCVESAEKTSHQLVRPDRTGKAKPPCPAGRQGLEKRLLGGSSCPLAPERDWRSELSTYVATVRFRRGS